MRLISLGVRSFGCVEEARIELRPGLNVLYGPNDLGKSTLVHAIRAALLLPSSHREAEGFRPWHRDAIPEVDLVFSAVEQPGSTQPPRIWRVRKSFGGGRRGHADLEWSNDGERFALEQKGSGVDAKLRQMLGWGVVEARARGPRGFPGSFLATVLLGPQAVPGSMLAHSLDDDPSESGRERLTEALQALAQDPRFKEVLDQAQHKVDEAFTPTGKPRKGKASPLSPIKQRIDSLAEELRQLELRVHDSDDVRQQVLQLDSARAEAIASRDDAEAVRREAREVFEQSQRRALALAKVQAASEALDAGRSVLAERTRWQEAAQRHLEARPAAEAALIRAQEVERAAAHGQAEAEAVLRSIEEGGDAEAKLARQQLETRRLELRAFFERLHAGLRRIEQALALAQSVDAKAEELEALGRDLAVTRGRAKEAEGARREADAERKLYDEALRLRRWQDAARRVEQAEQAEVEAKRLLAEADVAEAEARPIDEALTREALPEPETLERWRAQAEERKVVQARLGVGISVVVHRSSATRIQAKGDDGSAQKVVIGQPIEAERRLRLELGDDTEIEVQGGDPRARADLETIEERWTNEVTPVLRRLGADDLAAVQQRVAEAREQRDEVERLRREAETKRGLAAARRERVAELPELRRAFEGCEEALAGLDRVSLSERAGDYAEAELQQRRTHAEARVEEARHRHATIAAQLAGLGSEREARVQEHGKLVAERVEVLASVPGDPEVERDAAFDRLAAVEGQQEEVEAELVTHDEARERRRVEAGAAVTDAQAETDRAKLASSLATRELEARKEQLAQAEGRLAQLQAQAAAIDAAALEAELERQETALREHPMPKREVSVEELATANETMAASQRGLREIEAKLDQQRGALKQVGGAVAREEAERTRDALETAKQSERDLELDYEAWRLLTQTLKEAETAEGRHLGEVLGGPVHERFSALTGGRYGALTLGRDLKAEGLEVAGDLRDVRALSEGVQDQLATILRLAVAEHLGSALVLDDHLVQTDPARVAWFRQLLVEVGQKAQIVVLTCRPGDYLGADERPGEGEAMRDTERVRAVDLGQVITRAG